MKSRHSALIATLVLLTTLAWTAIGAGDSNAASVYTQVGLELTPDVVMQTVITHARVIVRARVAQTTSSWSQDRSQILSQSELEIHYILRGSLDDAPIVNTVGGHLPDENLSMMTSDAPMLVEGEEVVLLLAPSPRPNRGYEIVAGHNGKFTVHDGQLQFSSLLHLEPLETFYTRLHQQDASVQPPANWQSLEAAIAASAPVAAADFVYKGMRWFNNIVEFKVNLNSAQMGGEDGTADDFLYAIMNAAFTWSMVAEADFTLLYGGATDATGVAYNRSNDIFFEDRGQVDENGFRRPLAVATIFYSSEQILDTDIWINDAYDWDATGQPDRTEIDLESVLLHEMGHWLSLGHDSDSRAVMYYAITAGTLKRSLYENDRNGIIFIYPCADSGGCTTLPPTATPTTSPTATLTVTPTASPTATASPTPTATPTAPSTPASALVTAGEGGVIEYTIAPNAQVSLAIPPGAVLTDTVMSIESITVSVAPPDRLHPLFSYFRIAFGPGAMTDASFDLRLPAILTVVYTMPVGSASNPEAIRFLALDTRRGVWEEIACTTSPIDDETQRMSTQIVHPATFGLFREENKLYLPAVTR